ncbi:MAG TPA: hypothetical protein VN783_02880 [Thermoanaerobaculia bacterium]|nr:hypothetical protein [Thermoanaerobaculia bacterium]
MAMPLVASKVSDGNLEVQIDKSRSGASRFATDFASPGVVFDGEGRKATIEFLIHDESGDVLDSTIVNDPPAQELGSFALDPIDMSCDISFAADGAFVFSDPVLPSGMTFNVASRTGSILPPPGLYNLTFNTSFALKATAISFPNGQPSNVTWSQTDNVNNTSSFTVSIHLPNQAPHGISYPQTVAFLIHAVNGKKADPTIVCDPHT